MNAASPSLAPSSGIYEAVSKCLSCGTRWTRSQWCELPAAGTLKGDRGELLELRRCSCSFPVANQFHDHE